MVSKITSYANALTPKECSSLTVSRAPSISTSHTAMLHPCLANSIAIALPSPFAPPVI